MLLTKVFFFLKKGKVYYIKEIGFLRISVDWREQPPCTLVTAFSRTSLVLERFCREFRIPFKSQKQVSKTYRPKNNNICLLMTLRFFFLISYTSIAFTDVAEIPFSREKLS